MKKIAVLSNINMNPAARLLAADFAVYETEGYGNELETLMNQNSSLYAFDPEAVFLFEDLMEIIGHELSEAAGEVHIAAWFAALSASLDSGRVYFISDAYLYGAETALPEVQKKKPQIERLWDSHLRALVLEHPNVFVFPYRTLVERFGEERAFQSRLWYLGKIMHSMEMQKRICAEIRRQLAVLESTPKKVLVLDLDNTLWGGLAGENDQAPVLLSDDGAGLAYKNAQRVIRQMKDTGTVLCIASKNNEDDAMEILEKNPHMVLRPDDFAVRKISWNDKASSIRKIAEELNVGLDSIVFADDSPQERALVKELLPMVAVPEFPAQPEDLPVFFAEVYGTFFARTRVTEEDREKTAQYASNARRNQLREETATFEDYLRSLDITVIRVDASKNLDRVLQLVNKTNQFNLTARRYTMPEMQAAADTKRIYAFRVADRFGDSGITAAVIVDTGGEIPLVEEFTMSCRIMGRSIEYGIMDFVEADLAALGYDSLRARYVPTKKNHPVSELYDRLGYKPQGTSGGIKEYRIALKGRKKRDCILTFSEKEGNRI